MRYHRFWIEIVLLGTLVACVLALLLATLGAAAGAASDENSAVQTQVQTETKDTAHAQQVFEGMVTCSHCGARHSAALNRSASNCVRICVHGGSSFALVQDESIYMLQGDPVALKKLAGQRAEIVGTRTGQIINVSSASAKS